MVRSFFVRIRLPENLPPDAREALSNLVPRVAARFSFQGLEDWAIDVKNSRVLGVEAEFHDLSREGKRSAEMRVYFARKADGDRFALFLRTVFEDIVISPTRLLAPRDWMKAWRKHYRIQLLREGKRTLALVPAWKKAPRSASLSVRIYPGQAFGTGTHPTTQLCLRLFLRHATSIRKVMDFGAGTGVLVLAAEKACRASGEKFRALAVESDPVALEQCRKNAGINGAEGIRFYRRVPSKVQVELLFANVLAPVLLAERGMLLRSVKPGGLLLLSGLLSSESEAFLKKFSAKGFVLVEHALQGDWAAIALRRK